MVFCINENKSTYKGGISLKLFCLLPKKGLLSKREELASLGVSSFPLEETSFKKVHVLGAPDIKQNVTKVEQIIFLLE